MFDNPKKTGKKILIFTNKEFFKKCIVRILY